MSPEAYQLTVGQKQELFTRCLAKLLVFALDEGYQIRMGECWRPKITAEAMAKAGKGIKNSAHTRKLAVDLNLFRGGKYLTDSEDHRPLGEYWKSLDPLCRWGGDFKHRDGNHYSIYHYGIA